MTDDAAGITDTAATLGERFRVQRATRSSRAAAILGLGLLAILASLPAWSSGGPMRLLVEFFTLLAMAQMWNLLAGFAGLVSIGQQAFVGLGAYGLFAFADLVGLGAVPAIAATSVLAIVVAAAMSLFAFRLTGGYFAVGTWVLAEIFRIFVLQRPDLGAGTGVTISSFSDMDPRDRLSLTYWLALGVGFGSIALVALLMRSRLGLALRAIRDSELSAASMGVDVLRTKRIVYIVASAVCAVAGAVFYLQLLRIQPAAAFSVDWTARMIFIVVIGGLGRIEGPIIGAIVFFALQETLADFGSAYLVTLGIIAIVIVLIAPRGLWGLLESWRPISLFAIQRRLVPVATSGPTAEEPTP
jgi:branched-chain amino acid transport system permease protein